MKNNYYNIESTSLIPYKSCRQINNEFKSDTLKEKKTMKNYIFTAWSIVISVLFSSMFIFSSIIGPEDPRFIVYLSLGSVAFSSLSLLAIFNSLPSPQEKEKEAILQGIERSTEQRESERSIDELWRQISRLEDQLCELKENCKTNTCKVSKKNR
jgi:archaellum biogenesis protein FlaJ (TadC family)